jgi:hypothetical protein
MPLETNRHLEEEEIEKYSIGDITEEESSRFEEHLLACESCQNRVTACDSYVATMQAASARIRQDGMKAARRRWYFPKWVPIATAFAAVTVLSVFGIEWAARRKGNPGNLQPAYAVTLVAMRGNGIEARVPAGRDLTFRLDLAGLPPEATYRLELVDGHGIQVWQGAVHAQNSLGIVSVPKMDTGSYFLRAYAPSGNLLREYGIEVEGR